MTTIVSLHVLPKDGICGMWINVMELFFNSLIRRTQVCREGRFK